ncbi:hypothetical protein [Aurantiacibacter sp. MUD61]|uniref:hypothetical protein n=1 Tax=Aurantiacibacter sp. MUD61 TaxID=3009083 RepID=UPI0022F108BF|nr:hypothetical protein [Aurantiacibacter sp. MUD61]
MITRRTVLWVVPVAISLTLIAIGLTYPVYTDYEAARKLKLNACLDEPRANGSRVVDGWHERLRALETLRHPLMQTGISVILATLTVLGLSRFFYDADPGEWRTPSERWQFFALGTGAVALSLISQLYSLSLDFRRGDFPWCADSMGIPFFGLLFLYPIMWLVFLVIGAILAFKFGRLPARLMIWRDDKPLLSITLTIVFGAAAIGIAVLGIDSARFSAFIGTPAAVVAIYLLVATRAALLSPKISPDE